MSKQLDKITKLEQRVIEDYGYKESGFIQMLERSDAPDAVKDILIIFSNQVSSEISTVKQINMDLIDLVKDQYVEIENGKEELVKSKKKSVFGAGGLWMIIGMFLLFYLAMFFTYMYEPDIVVKVMVLMIDFVGNMSKILWQYGGRLWY